MPQDIVPAGSFYSARLPEQPVLGEQGSLGWKTTKQFVFVIFKWQRLVVGLALAFVIAAAVAMLLKPPVRIATAKIMLKSDRIPLQISGLTGFGSKVPYSAEVMQSEIQFFKSRAILLPVAQKLLSKRNGPSGKLDPEEIDATILNLERNTVAVAVPSSNIIQVTYFAPTSEQAERVLRMIVDEYVEQQAALQSGSTKLLQFYEQEKKRVGAELLEAENTLEKWQQKNKTVSVDQEISDQLKMLSERENQLQQTVTQMQATRTKTATLKRQLSSQPERVVSSRSQILNPLVTKLKADLATAELALQDTLQRYTDKDRRVQEKKEQVALIKRELAAAEREEVIGNQTVSLNPLRQDIKKALVDGENLLTSLDSQREVLKRQVQDISASLENLRDKKVEFSRLTRIVDLRRDSFLLYDKKLEEARIGAGLGKEQLANIALIEQPHATQQTDLLKRLAVVVMAAFMGLALGFAIAFGVEFFNNTFRTQDDIEHYLRLPMLAAIPDLQGRPLLLKN